MIRKIKINDAASIVEIYNHYIESTVITFEEEPLSIEEMVIRIKEIDSIGLPWLVAEESGRILGYAYASKWKGRCAYRYSVETTVYVSPQSISKGYGSALYSKLFTILRENSFHSAIGGISLPNQASIALHEKFGMEKVAQFKEVGFKFGQWIDVGYWQVILNA